MSNNNFSSGDTLPMVPGRKTQSTFECGCCRLVRSDKSSRLSLPLARRGRPYTPSRSPRKLCKKCLEIKQKQEEFYHYADTNSSNIFETITSLDKTSKEDHKHQMIIQDIPHQVEFSLINGSEELHLNNSDYESAQMLVWKMNTSDHPTRTNIIESSYDTGSLTANEKKLLLEEAVQKLQTVLHHRSSSSSTTTTIPDSDLDQIEFTYRALQTTVNILLSSLNSL